MNIPHFCCKKFTFFSYFIILYFFKLILLKLNSIDYFYSNFHEKKKIYYLIIGTSLDDDEVNDVSESNSFYFSINKNAKWDIKPIKVNGRTRQPNINTHLPRVKGETKNTKNNMTQIIK